MGGGCIDADEVSGPAALEEARHHAIGSSDRHVDVDRGRCPTTDVGVDAGTCAELFLSPATARTHVSRAMVKLQARDRAQLVVIAYQTGLVTPDTTSTLTQGRDVRWQRPR